ncbi:MAG: LamG domain-containing protein [Pyrinomonadaceae bacterium]
MKSLGKGRILRLAVLSVFTILCLWAVNQTNSTQILAQKNSGNGVTTVPFSLFLFGNNAALSVAHSDQLNTTDALTLEAWIKISDTSGSQVVIDRLTNNLEAGSGGYQLLVENGRAAFLICPTNLRSSCISTTGSTIIQPDRWQHIAAVYEPGKTRVYLDGQLNGLRERGIRAPGFAVGAMTIGSSPRGVNRFRGLIDEVRISNTAVYTAAFSPLIQPAIEPATVGLWRFDNGSMNDWSIYNHQTTTIGAASFSPDVPVGTGSGFILTETPNVGPRNQLNDVVTISPNDAWAVGYHGPANQCCFPATPVSLRWNGTQWNNIPIPLPEGYSSGIINSVDAAPDSNNVWAVGTVRIMFSQSAYRDDGWLLRWDGTQWTTAAIFEDPVYPDYGIGTVKSVSVVNDNDLWVVGGRIGGKSLTLHWDGKSLTTIPSPNADQGGNALNDVSVISSNDVWAVGSFMAIRWNGTEWQIVPGAIPRYVHMNSVSAVSSNEVWVVGGVTSCGPFEGCSGSSSVLRFDGTNWSFVPYDSVPGTSVNLRAVSASVSNDVWVVGIASPDSYVAHFENGRFARKPSQQSPQADGNLDVLQSVSALNPDTVFAVGYAIEITTTPHSERRDNLALRKSSGF